MGRKLTQMSMEDVRNEMSIAGDPDKIMLLMKDIFGMIGSQCDKTNCAEIINVEFALQRILAEVKLWQRIYHKTH